MHTGLNQIYVLLSRTQDGVVQMQEALEVYIRSEGLRDMHESHDAVTTLRYHLWYDVYLYY